MKRVAVCMTVAEIDAGARRQPCRLGAGLDRGDHHHLVASLGHLAGAGLADTVEEQTLHMINSDPKRTPTFTLFGPQLPEWFAPLHPAESVFPRNQVTGGTASWDQCARQALADLMVVVRRHMGHHLFAAFQAQGEQEFRPAEGLALDQRAHGRGVVVHDVVGAQQHGLRNLDAERPRSPQVHAQPKLGRLHHRHVRRFRALKDSVHIIRSVAIERVPLRRKND